MVMFIKPIMRLSTIVLWGFENNGKRIALDLDQKEDLSLFQTRSEKVKKAYLETFRDKNNGLINDGEDTDHKISTRQYVCF